MASLLAHFEPSELVDFMNFIGLLVHKLQVGAFHHLMKVVCRTSEQEDMFDVLDQLIGPLSAHINAVMFQAVSGTDDELARADTKKAYLALLNNIMVSKLHPVFISERELT